MKTAWTKNTPWPNNWTLEQAIEWYYETYNAEGMRVTRQQAENRVRAYVEPKKDFSFDYDAMLDMTYC